MSDSPANQTIVGRPLDETYQIVKLPLPDGKTLDVLVQRARSPQGEEVWEMVDQKLKDFDARFSDTTTIPGSWRVPTTGSLTPNDPSPEVVAEGGMTRIDLRRHLTLNLGDPQRIITNKGLDDYRKSVFLKNPAHLSLLCEMARKHGTDWAAAAEFLRPLYQTV